MSIEAYPLCWPAGWPRTKYPEEARFTFGRERGNWSRGSTSGRSLDDLLLELDRLGATNIVISTNIALRQDGLPYANRKAPEDPGVAVYFDLKGEHKSFPCDRWDRVADNYHAIGLSIGALRGLNRWGASHMVDAAFRGFKALPAGPQWWQTLGLESDDVTNDEIRSAFKKRAREAHPDTGGSHDEMVRVKDAYDTGLQLRS